MCSFIDSCLKLLRDCWVLCVCCPDPAQLQGAGGRGELEEIQRPVPAAAKSTTQGHVRHLIAPLVTWLLTDFSPYIDITFTHCGVFSFQLFCFRWCAINLSMALSFWTPSFTRLKFQESTMYWDIFIVAFIWFTFNLTVSYDCSLFSLSISFTRAQEVTLTNPLVFIFNISFTLPFDHVNAETVLYNTIVLDW